MSKKKNTQQKLREQSKVKANLKINLKNGVKFKNS